MKIDDAFRFQLVQKFRCSFKGCGGTVPMCLCGCEKMLSAYCMTHAVWVNEERKHLDNPEAKLARKVLGLKAPVTLKLRKNNRARREANGFCA